VGFHGTMFALQLAGGVLAGVLLIQLDKVFQHLRNAAPLVHPDSGQELFVMPRLYVWMALAFGLAALAVAGAAIFLTVGGYQATARLPLPQLLGLGLLGLAVSCLPGLVSYQLFKMGSYRVRVDARGVLEFRYNKPRFLAWADLKQVVVQARGKRLVLKGLDSAVDLEFQVAGFHRLLELLLRHLPPVAGTLPSSYGRPGVRRRTRIQRALAAALILGAGAYLEPWRRLPAFGALAALVLFNGDGQGKGTPPWIRHVKLGPQGVTLEAKTETTVLPWDELESVAIEDHLFKATVHVGTHLRAKDGRSFRVDAAVADPFVLAPALREAMHP